MKITIDERVKRIAVITPEGQFDNAYAPTAEKKFVELVDDGVTDFIIDLSNTSLMDSAGMAVLIGLLKRVQQNNGDAKLVWPRAESAQRILKLTRFDRVFEVVDTAESALQSF
ncbi:MAG: STAS domain-containing protein [Anaerolineae bacterium]|nr:STAS domain-containing protein [Anaerolineae bacterium]